ncbi:MAG: sterol desaturase family protein [Caulobacterales bacterium]
MDFLRSLIFEIAGYDLSLISLFAFFIALEALLPRDDRAMSVMERLKAKAPARIKAAAFWLVWVPFSVVIVQAFQLFWTAYGFRPLFPDLAPPGLPRPVGVVIAAIAAAFIGDFFYYWCHRAQHRFFWKFHAIHHSVRDMSGMAAYHHFTEPAFRIALYAVPMAIFINDPFGIPVLGVILGLHGNYLHSPTRIHFGPVGRFIQDNRFHRIHHSIEPKHFDKNFGVFTTLWDWMFGTAYFPAADEWPQTGVPGEPEPETIRDYLLRPFASGARRPARAEA